VIIDGHIHVANQPDDAGFRAPVLDADTLLRLMEGPFPIMGQPRRVDHALIQPMISPTRSGDPLEHHRYIRQQVELHSDRLTGCFVANPLLDAPRTIEVMRELIRSRHFRAVKLHPTNHGYMPFKSRDRLDPILEEVAALRVPVIVHQGDPPFAHPTQMAPVIEAFPQVTFILAHFGTQRVVLADEAIYVARKNKNVYLETGWGALPRIKEGIAAIGPERLVFGSDCPIQEIGSQLRVIEVLTWEQPLGIKLSEAHAEGIMGDNLARLLQLRTAS
jgi:predicted TIM-barrel fold metal-dependent hydrolase